MKEVAGLKVKYIEPREQSTKQEDHNRLVKFVTLFSQIGFQEISLNPNTNIELNYSK